MSGVDVYGSRDVNDESLFVFLFPNMLRGKKEPTTETNGVLESVFVTLFFISFSLFKDDDEILERKAKGLKFFLQIKCKRKW